MLTVRDISRYFLYLGSKNRKPINSKKLQKLLYYAQAWYLTFRDEPLFNEDIYAWVYGPAVKSIYLKYKKYGFDRINEPVNIKFIYTIPDDVKGILNSVWDNYGKFDADYLVMLSHSETPWIEARKGLQPTDSSDNIISLEAMKEYYSKKLEL